MNIVVAVDYSECSSAACRWVLERAIGLGVEELVFVHVVDPAAGAELGTLERAGREVRRFVEGLRVAAPEGVELCYTVRRGRPTDEILAAAADAKASSIVMGTNSRTGLDRLLLGSVAESVVRLAPCTVIVVKAPA